MISAYTLKEELKAHGWFKFSDNKEMLAYDRTIKTASELSKYLIDFRLFPSSNKGFEFEHKSLNGTRIFVSESNITIKDKNISKTFSIDEGISFVKTEYKNTLESIKKYCSEHSWDGVFSTKPISKETLENAKNVHDAIPSFEMFPCSDDSIQFENAEANNFVIVSKDKIRLECDFSIENALGILNKIL